MIIFFDTEFTTMDKNGVRRLISIGCVSETGEEFYCELTDTYFEGLCSEWVIQNVLPLLQGGKCRMAEAVLAVRLKDWIERLTDKEVIFRSDCPRIDWEWVESLFKFYGWPKNLRRQCGAISFDHDDHAERYALAFDDYWKDNSARRHHALIDARSLMFAWKRAVE